MFFFNMLAASIPYAHTFQMLFPAALRVPADSGVARQTLLNASLSSHVTI